MSAIRQSIEFFFAPPVPEQTRSARSPLHVNRREAQLCLFGEVRPERLAVGNPDTHRPFATVMVIAAGVDLLSQFFAGSNAPGGTRRRIMAFATAFMFGDQSLPRELAAVFYLGCRNPMQQSFSLLNDHYTIVLTDGLSKEAIERATIPDESVSYVLSVPALYRTYVQAIRRYRAALEADAGLQTKFSAMFPLYGSITVFSAHPNAL